MKCKNHSTGISCKKIKKNLFKIKFNENLDNYDDKRFGCSSDDNLITYKCQNGGSSQI